MAGVILFFMNWWILLGNLPFSAFGYCTVYALALYTGYIYVRIGQQHAANTQPLAAEDLPSTPLSTSFFTCRNKDLWKTVFKSTCPQYICPIWNCGNGTGWINIVNRFRPPIGWGLAPEEPLCRGEQLHQNNQTKSFTHTCIYLLFLQVSDLAGDNPNHLLF